MDQNSDPAVKQEQAEEPLVLRLCRMVEWEGQQVSPASIPVEQTMNSSSGGQTCGLASSVSEQWLTSDIINLAHEADSLCSAMLQPESIKVGRPVSEVSSDVKFLDEEESAHVPTATVNVSSSSLLDIPPNLYDPWELNSGSMSLACGKSYDQFMETHSLIPMWGLPLDVDYMKMDDVFQVDKADLFHGPTLAELNANDESLFDSLDTFDLCLPSENKTITTSELSKPHTVTHSYAALLDIVESNGKSSNSLRAQSAMPVIKSEPEPDTPSLKSQNLNATHLETPLRLSINTELACDLKIKKEPSACESRLQTVPSLSPNSSGTNFVNSGSAVVAIKQEVDDETFIVKQETLDEASCERNVVESEHLSNMSLISNDEGFDSQGENSDNEMFSSDVESGDNAEEDTSPTWTRATEKWSNSKKKTRYFWQYNIQSKGPKGPKVKLSSNFSNPHVLGDIMDPVFSTVCQIKGVKHAGKARRGDGNDLTPNPRKLYNIGIELQKLNSIINDLTPVNELPFNARPTSRKEKNKLASRACRLKKKAQHEANKLKFFGLQKEHKILLKLVREAKGIIRSKLQNVKHYQKESCQEMIKILLNKSDIPKIAGCTAEFVNSVLDRVATGDPNGGLSKM